MLLTVKHWSKSIFFNRLGAAALLGLAVCVFFWGLGYKLSLYAPPQTAPHRIPEAKLLSKNEQSGDATCPLVTRTRTFTKVAYTAPAAILLNELLVISPPNPPTTAELSKLEDKTIQLRRAAGDSLFVRPPPVFV